MAEEPVRTAFDVPDERVDDGGSDLEVKGACGRTLVQRRSMDGRLNLRVQPPPGREVPSPCTRCRRDCAGELVSLIPVTNSK